MSNLLDPIRVLIADDSRIFRGLMEQSLATIEGVAIVGSVFNGRKAIEFIQSNSVDLITLDIEMPVLNGLETLKEIQAWNEAQMPSARTESILVSSLTKHGAACTVEGLQLGALDYFLKPSGPDEDANLDELRRLLVEKIDLVRAKRSGRKPGTSSHATSQLKSNLGRLTGTTSASRTGSLNASAVIGSTSHEALPRNGYQAIAIGISTGGPEALAQLLPSLVGKTSLPIFIIQHNLHGLSGFMADSLSRRTRASVKETQEGMPVVPNSIYLAKAGTHTILRTSSQGCFIGLSDAPPENHSRPAVDVFFRSASLAYGAGLIAVVMTGMLNDGANGVRVVKRAGGFTIAQDQASSVIWGMPRAAIETGCVDCVASLDRIGPAILERIARAAST
jgi:two-component system, chemotaxis family, protein-glutamate methylesterase/glutaminase